MFEARISAAMNSFDPDQANIGRLSAEKMGMSVERPDRTGPIGWLSCEWNTAMNRVTPPSTRSS